VMQWLDAKPSDPPEWQQAAHFGDSLLLLSSDELAELGREMQALLDRYADRPESRERRRAAAIYFAFPEERPGGP